MRGVTGFCCISTMSSFRAGLSAPYWQTLQPKLDVVYEDADILVANKPSGLLSQAENEPSLEGYYRAYLYQKGEFDPSAAHAYLPSLCHRIDRNTAGLVLAAKHAEAHRILSQKLRGSGDTKVLPMRDRGGAGAKIRDGFRLSAQVPCRKADAVFRYAASRRRAMQHLLPRITGGRQNSSR